MAEVYTSITEETVKAARDRAFCALDLLTDGNAEKAIACVSEYVELDSIYKEIQKRKALYDEAEERRE